MYPLKKNGTCTFMVRKHFSPTVTNQILHCLKIYFQILIFIHGCFITLIFQRYMRYEELRPLLFKNCKTFVLNCFFLQSYDFFSFYVTERDRRAYLFFSSHLQGSPQAIHLGCHLIHWKENRKRQRAKIGSWPT